MGWGRVFTKSVICKEQPDSTKIIEVKLSDKTVFIEKEKLKDMDGQKITNSPAFYNDDKSILDLSFIDSQAFELMQKLTALKGPQLFTFLNATTKESFDLIRVYANQLKLQGKFLSACDIKVLQDPVFYGRDIDWIAKAAGYISYPFNSDGMPDYDYNKPRNVILEYLGSDFWDKYKHDYNREDYDTYQKRMNAIYCVIAQINYYQGVFQKPAPLKTDFLKECFYKLEVQDQNRLLNNNLVTLS